MLMSFAFVACWRLIVVHYYCLSVPPCYSFLVFIVVSLLHSSLLVGTSSLGTLWPPCIFHYLIDMHSCCSLTSHCCVLLVFFGPFQTGVSFIYYFVQVWKKITFNFFFNYKIFSLIVFFCIFSIVSFFERIYIFLLSFI